MQSAPDVTPLAVLPSQEQGALPVDLLGDYLRESEHCPRLSAQEERHHLARLAEGDQQARTRLIESNLRLVVAIATRYQGPDGFGTPLLDLIGYGNLGLVRAVDKYNPAFGVRFATYATYHIRAAILRALDEQGRLIRCSSYQIEQSRRLSALSDALTHQLGRTPTLGDLALHSGQSERSLACAQTVEQTPLSLDASLSSTDDETALHETLASQQTPDPLQVCCEQERAQDMHRAVTLLLAALTPREREVIACRFGLDGKGERDALATGKELGMCRSRVYQLFHAALGKLRRAAAAQGMTAHLFESCAEGAQKGIGA